MTGRPRGVYRRFGLSRISLREMANNGLIPEFQKQVGKFVLIKGIFL